jgi:hypothetical protein
MMDVHVRGGPADPFLGARDLFTTEYDLSHPVTVQVKEDPDERTRVHHEDAGHILTISRQAATSAMARELTLHEFAHMARHEEGHPSHVQSTREAIYLALSGQSVERRTLAHCYQIANHMKDIYADDVWLPVAPADKLVAFLESQLAAALAAAPVDPPTWDRLTPAADPEITAVNAAFALAILERHDLLSGDHRLYDLARAAAADAPGVSVDQFKDRFRSLARDPDESEYRKALVDVTRAYAGGDSSAAAD